MNEKQCQERAKALKRYFDDARGQYDEGLAVDEADAIERMREIREKGKTSGDRSVENR